MNPKLAPFLFCLIGCVSFAQTTPTAPKPPLSAPKDAKFFNGKWYAVFADKVSWQVAKDKCARMDGQLVVVHDRATWDFVNTLTPLRVWLGATDERLEGEWVWVDGQKMSFNAWSPGNPDNAGGREHFLSTIPNSDKWNDVMKDWDSYRAAPIVGYICEWKAR